MVPNSDFFLKSLVLKMWAPPIPICRSNAVFRVAAGGGRSDLRSTKTAPTAAASTLLVIFFLFGTLLEWATSANFLSSSSELFFVTCWTFSAELIAITLEIRFLMKNVVLIWLSFWWKEIRPLRETNDCDIGMIEGRKYSRWDETWFGTLDK